MGVIRDKKKGKKVILKGGRGGEERLKKGKKWLEKRKKVILKKGDQRGERRVMRERKGKIKR